MLEMTIDSYSLTNLHGKKLVILGLARQGKAFARFAAGQGAQVVVSDLRSADLLAPTLAELADLPIQYVLGEHPLTLLDDAQLLLVSGGVPISTPLVQHALQKGILVTNDEQEFLRRSPAPVIGITGSAGKSTTTSLTGEMGKASGRKTWVGGNIGSPLIAELGHISSADLVVQELSSFQLELWHISPSIAAILNITPNHLDRHKTMAAYTEAKAQILRHQSADSVAVLPADSLHPLRHEVQGRLRLFSSTQAVEDGACMQGDQLVLRNGQQEVPLIGRSALPLRGQHNLLNTLAAATLADSADLPIEAIRQAITTFTGIPHRLERVAIIDGVQYINDSIATAPERALAALRAFDEPIILLAGGRDKDLNWEAWLAFVEKRCKAVVLFGEIGEMIGRKMSRSSLPHPTFNTLAQATQHAHHIATSGDIVLLSPGGTSFDAFTDFAERGEQFRQQVQQLAKGNTL